MPQALNQPIVKRFAITLLALAVLVSITVFLWDWLSYRSVKFDLSSETKSAVIYSEGEYELYMELDDEPVPNSGQLNKTDTVRLKPGTYYVIPSGDVILTDPVEVTIGNDTSKITINPYFSEEYLANKFSDQIANISTVIKNKYPDIIDNYTIEDGTFYHFGDWYITVLYENTDGPEFPDSYGVILHKVNEEWQIAAKPSLYFTYKDYSNIPRDIISAVNSTVN